MSQGLYRIEAVLGGGAQALVCLAVEAAGRRPDPVVLKVVRSEFLNHAESLDRIRDEGRILNRLHHPNILRASRIGLRRASRDRDGVH